VTNLSPNHLNRHITMENYAAAKQAILAYQKDTDVAVLNMDDPATADWHKYTPARIVRFSVKQEPEGDGAFLDGEKLVVRLGDMEEAVALRASLRLPGQHNAANALAAAAAAMAMGVQPWQVAEALATFSGLPHRLEMVARGQQEVTYYNDSIATTPESVMCALASFNGPVTLIAGGSDKGCPFDELGVMIARKVRRLILMGVTAPKIQESVVRAAHVLRRCPVILHVHDLEHAVRTAATDTVPGEVVLLSPACASFDMFRNFEERGDKFRLFARRVAAQ
jgi:UDP-N-acetylmuramoylalanine--D-glutamate ligase